MELPTWRVANWSWQCGLATGAGIPPTLFGRLPTEDWQSVTEVGNTVVVLPTGIGNPVGELPTSAGNPPTPFGGLPTNPVGRLANGAGNPPTPFGVGIG